TWRTIGGIARQTGLSEERVAQILDKYKAIVKGASLPVPFPEQIGDAIAEAGQQVFAVGSSEQLALARRITDFNTLLVGIDKPGDLRATGEKVAEPLVNLRPGL